MRSRFAFQRQLTTNIVVVGKKNSVESWIADGYGEYEKRLKPLMNINTVFLKSDEDLVAHVAALVAKNKAASIIALDEHGKVMTSREFSKYYYQAVQDGDSHVHFIIGAAEGLPDVIRKKHQTLSLSAMTWTHQMARLLLIEQIYRATEIYKNSSYHKD